jgi:hypothetical protein
MSRENQFDDDLSRNPERKAEQLLGRLQERRGMSEDIRSRSSALRERARELSTRLAVPARCPVCQSHMVVGPHRSKNSSCLACNAEWMAGPASDGA